VIIYLDVVGIIVDERERHYVFEIFLALNGRIVMIVLFRKVRSEWLGTSLNSPMLPSMSVLELFNGSPSSRSRPKIALLDRVMANGRHH
jgi:hypothetical protein